MLQKLCHGSILDALLFRKLLYQTIIRHNQGCHELAFVGNDGNLVDVTVHYHLGFDGLWSDVLTVRSLEQILDTFGQEQEVIFDITGIACAEPTVFGKRRLRGCFLLIIPLGDGRSLQQDFIILTKLHLHVRHQFAYRTHHVVEVVFARHCGDGFGQAITRHHIDAYRKNKILNGRWNSSSCRREESSSIQTQCLLQQAIDGLFIKLVFHVQPHRRSLSLTNIFHIMFTTHLDGIQHQRLLHTRCTVDDFLHSGIHLFPETGHATHSRRTHFLDSHLDVLRTEIDIQLSTHTQTPAAPGTFKHMRKRQEIDDHIVFTQTRETLAVCIHHRFITCMTQHHTLAFAGRATGIKDIHQVFRIRFGGTLVHFRLMLTILAHRQEIIEIDGRLVLRFEFHIAVEHNDLFQRSTQCHHTESHIILLLFAYKEIADAGIFQDIMDLSFRTGGIKRNCHRADAERTEIHE